MNIPKEPGPLRSVKKLILSGLMGDKLPPRGGAAFTPHHGYASAEGLLCLHEAAEPRLSAVLLYLVSAVSHPPRSPHHPGPRHSHAPPAQCGAPGTGLGPAPRLSGWPVTTMQPRSSYSTFLSSGCPMHQGCDGVWGVRVSELAPSSPRSLLLLCPPRSHPSPGLL